MEYAGRDDHFLICGQGKGDAIRSHSHALRLLRMENDLIRRAVRIHCHSRVVDHGVQKAGL